MEMTVNCAEYNLFVLQMELAPVMLRNMLFSCISAPSGTKGNLALNEGILGSLSSGNVPPPGNGLTSYTANSTLVLWHCDTIPKVVKGSYSHVAAKHSTKSEE